MNNHYKQHTKKLAVLLLIFLAHSTFAVKPRTQTHNSLDAFKRGDLKNVSILHDGVLTLAPKLNKMLDTGDPYSWDAVSDSKGNIYLGTGNDGRVYKITVQQDSVLFFDAGELQVFALEIDQNDNLYVGTSPDGKIYKIDPKGRETIFYEPQEKYIWDMIFDYNNNLFVSTGNPGKIYKISGSGVVNEFYKSEQTHIRCLAIDGSVLYAGSSGPGYVYRFNNDNTPFVLYDSQMNEIHNLVVDDDGYVYAAAFGEAPSKLATDYNARSLGASSGRTATKKDNAGASKEITLTPQAIIPESILAAQKERTALYRISPNGYGKDIWSVSEESIHSLLWYQGELWVGTGNKGKLYRVDSSGKAAMVVQLDESLISDLFVTSQNKIVLLTSNMGRCYLLDTKAVSKGVYESETIDTGLLSKWGTLTWEGKPGDGRLEFYTRSGNTERPEKSWNPWKRTGGTDSVLVIQSDDARFIQWKCELVAGQQNNPTLDKVKISYLEYNLAPNISAVIIHRPNEYYDPSEIKASNPGQSGESNGLVLPKNLPSSQTKKGYRSVDWIFDDPNGDAMIFDLYYKIKTDGFWREMVKDWDLNLYSWDTFQMADGRYQIKVVAKDIPTNPKDKALTAEKKSDLFTIDNSPPKVSQFESKITNDKLVVIFTVSDKWNTISDVEYSLNADGWNRIFPQDDISDSQTESYRVEFEHQKEKDYHFAIRVTDVFKNVGVDHKIIKGNP